MNNLRTWAINEIGAKVQCYMHLVNGRREWTLLDTPNLDLSQATNEINKKLRATPIPQGDQCVDMPKWKLDKDGPYSVTTGYRSLLPTSEMNFPVKKIWIKGLTPKVAHFLLLAFRKCI